MTSVRVRLTALCVATATVLGAGLVACVPDPTPTPTPAFASEAEAYAAAEEVYRAYNDAENRDEATTEFLTADALEAEIEAERYLQDQQLSIEGEAVVIDFTGKTMDLTGPVTEITALVCLDVAASRVLDAEGSDVTPSDRQDRWLVTITFVGDRTKLLISASIPESGEAC